MKRKIYDRLLEWKNQKNGRTALLVEGARRVGKSYTVTEFAKKEYEVHLIINFSNAPEAIVNLFEKRTGDITDILQRLQIYTNIRFVKRNTLIVLDEVQLCPKARELIKFLVAEGSYDYIETGSLISIRDNVSGIVIPSEEERIQMHPMDFEEFCWAMGDEMTVPCIREHFDKELPLGQDLHEMVLDRFRRYMLVGGMPQAVMAYAREQSFVDAEEEKREILNLYRGDVMKSRNRKSALVFSSIPSGLQRHDKRIVFSEFSGRGTFSDLDEALFWLEESMMVNLCYNATEPSIGLRMKMDRPSVKCYMGDTGLLVTMSIDDNSLIEGEIYQALLDGTLHFNEGMFAENVVAQMLRSNGHRLYFHAFYNRESGNDRYEVDFLIRIGKKINPIEVKSGSSARHASLDKIMEKYPKHLSQPYIIHTKDLAKKGNVLYIPIYMAICL